MKIHTGNMWDMPTAAKVVPTNGIVTYQRGIPQAVMGAGVARQAADFLPYLRQQLGRRLHRYGNRVFSISLVENELRQIFCSYIVTFPTKRHYNDSSDIQLIERSLKQLVDLQQALMWDHVVLPAIGTGLGGLPKDVVYPLLEYYLDDSFHLVELP